MANATTAYKKVESNEMLKFRVFLIFYLSLSSITFGMFLGFFLFIGTYP